MGKVDWIIHLVANGACDECGKNEDSFLPFLCNAHTHGMQKYNHMDFQLVLHLPNKEIMRILNTLGLMVQDGIIFHDGDYVHGIYEDCVIQLRSFMETDRYVLRAILPDKQNRFPEQTGCEAPYCLQLLGTEMLSGYDPS